MQSEADLYCELALPENALAMSVDQVLPSCGSHAFAEHMTSAFARVGDAKCALETKEGLRFC